MLSHTRACCERSLHAINDLKAHSKANGNYLKDDADISYESNVEKRRSHVQKLLFDLGGQPVSAVGDLSSLSRSSASAAMAAPKSNGTFRDTLLLMSLVVALIGGLLWAITVVNYFQR
jgi:hypothetical protein